MSGSASSHDQCEPSWHEQAHSFLEKGGPFQHKTSNVLMSSFVCLHCCEGPGKAGATATEDWEAGGWRLMVPCPKCHRATVITTGTLARSSLGIPRAKQQGRQ